MSIVLDQVSKRYGERQAVRDLSLEIKSGELFAFLGPNGAGKTTTIKMICGLLRPDAGTVRVCGQEMNRHGLAARTRLAYVPDTPFVYEKLTAREFCSFVARLYQLPPEVAAERLEHWSTMLVMRDRLDQLAETFSHGMRQKLALMAALLHEPKVLVIDEPMVGLDPKSRRTVKQVLRGLALSGTTVFLSTHTLDIAEDIADRVGIINQGRLITVSSVSELMTAGGEERRRLEDIFLQLTEEKTPAKTNV